MSPTGSRPCPSSPQGGPVTASTATANCIKFEAAVNKQYSPTPPYLEADCSTRISIDEPVEFSPPP